MRGRAQPGCIVQRACPHATQAVIGTRRAANPGATLRANPSADHAPAISSPLDCSWLYAHETEGTVIYDDRQGERATGQALTIDTVACVNQLWRFGDLITDLAALTAASLWKFPGTTPPPLLRFGPCNNLIRCLSPPNLHNWKRGVCPIAPLR
jgi:hypothetical protein